MYLAFRNFAKIEEAFKSKSKTLTPIGVGFYSNMNATVFGDTSESVDEK